jgi:hypothetical protein
MENKAITITTDNHWNNPLVNTSWECKSYILREYESIYHYVHVPTGCNCIVIGITIISVKFPWQMKRNKHK